LLTKKKKKDFEVPTKLIKVQKTNRDIKDMVVKKSYKKVGKSETVSPGLS